MLKNYFLTALRTIVRQKHTSIINLLGLTLGIAASILLFLLIQYHVSFDAFNPNYDRVYRVVTTSEGSNGTFTTSGVPAPLASAFRIDFPQAEEVVFTQYQAGALVLVPQKNEEFKKYEEEKGVVYTEAGIFKIFPRDVIMGDAPKGLDEPNEAVISISLAKKYFNKEDVIGESIVFAEKEFKISAVVADPPKNTDLPFTLYLSIETIKKEIEEKSWGSIWSDEHCYFLLKENEDIKSVTDNLPAFRTKHNPGENYDNQTFIPQPLATLHFDDRFGNYNYNTVGKESLLALAIVAFFLIVTASINFINLTTAEAVKRSKEVGIRKTLGSSKTQLVFQFLGESSFITVVSTVLALGIAQIALTFLNPFLELELAFTFSTNLAFTVFVLSIVVFVSLLSGLYPAFYISSFSPASALKNTFGNKNSSGFVLRKGLVVTQFFISQFLIIGTLVLINQMNYFKSKDLGFKKDAIITLPVFRDKNSSDTAQTSVMRTLAHRISEISGVENYSLCNTPPSSGAVNGTSFLLEGESDDKRKETQVKTVDDKYMSLFNLKLIAGGNIDDLDTPRSVIVNKKLTEIAGFTNPAEIIGKRINTWGFTLPVVGVVENFHTTSLGSEIEPTVLFNMKRNYRTLSIQIHPQSFQQALPQIQKIWEETYPKELFSYRFLDESIREFYESEERTSILLSIFTTLAIVIGCLGLFGLATFMINQKNKEIGVRKVLGASVEGIVFMFSKEYVKLIGIGFTLAAPASWYIMNKWLDTFAYKIELGPVIFAVGFGITLLIACITVGYKSFKAANANPVKSLRYE